MFDNEDVLDTAFKGVELTASKRMRDRWQLLAGLTLGKNEGGVLTGDLNDPEQRAELPAGIEGTDSAYAFRAVGLVRGAVRHQRQRQLHPERRLSVPVGLRGHADGVPGADAIEPDRPAVQRRGDERLPDVAMIDLRVSRTFRFNDRRDHADARMFNLTNADTVVGYNANVGGSYLRPTEILSPRLLRLGISVDF